MPNIPVIAEINNLLDADTTAIAKTALGVLGAVTTGGALGTPTSGTLTNATGLPIDAGTSGTLPVNRGGTGTTTPAIVAGTNVTVSGTWPNQTVNAASGGTPAADSITTAMLQTGAVTDAKLAANAVTTAKILDANVTLAKITGLGTAATANITDIAPSYWNTTITPTGTNNSVLYTAVTPGIAQSAITVAYVISGTGSSVISVGVVGNAITVTCGSNTTANSVITAVNASGPASALVTASAISAVTGLVGTVSATTLKSPFSTNGGANKVPITTSSGNLILSATNPTGDWTGFSNSLFIGDWAGGGTRLVFMNTAGTGGSSIGHNTSHSGGGELQISSEARTALCLGPTGALQIGIATNSTYNKQFAYLQRRGDATGSLATTTSLPLFFSGSYWNGSASIVKDGPMIVGTPDGTTGRMFLDFNVATVVPNGGGTDWTGTLGMRLSENGGLSIPVQTITDANAVITKPLGDARYSARSVISSLSADTAGVTSSVAKVDSGIEITLVTGVTYEIEMMLSFTHIAAGGVRFGQSNAGALTVIGGIFDRGAGGAVAARSAFAGGVGTDGIVSEWSLAGGSSSNYLIRGLYTATTGGLLKIQYAQSVSDATATVLKKGSYIIARPQ